MKYLFDTITFLWWISDSRQLPARVLDVIKAPTNTIYLSIASVREMQVKSQIGRVDLLAPVLDIVQREREENGIEVLPISLEHIIALTRLPNHHGDPFDYLLITQAITEDLVILTNDARIIKYPVKTLW